MTCTGTANSALLKRTQSSVVFPVRKRVSEIRPCCSMFSKLTSNPLSPKPVNIVIVTGKLFVRHRRCDQYSGTPSFGNIQRARDVPTEELHALPAAVDSLHKHAHFFLNEFNEFSRGKHHIRATCPSRVSSSSRSRATEAAAPNSLARVDRGRSVVPRSSAWPHNPEQLARSDSAPTPVSPQSSNLRRPNTPCSFDPEEPVRSHDAPPWVSNQILISAAPRTPCSSAPEQLPPSHHPQPPVRQGFNLRRGAMLSNPTTLNNCHEATVLHHPVRWNSDLRRPKNPVLFRSEQLP